MIVEFETKNTHINDILYKLLTSSVDRFALRYAFRSPFAMYSISTIGFCVFDTTPSNRTTWYALNAFITVASFKNRCLRKKRGKIRWWLHVSTTNQFIVICHSTFSEKIRMKTWFHLTWYLHDMLSMWYVFSCNSHILCNNLVWLTSLNDENISTIVRFVRVCL